jgi:hypothetical protein
VNLTALAGQGVASGARRIAAATSPGVLVAAGLGAAWWYLNPPASTRRKVASSVKSILTCALGAAIAYQEVQDQFTSAAPKTPDWESLAADLPPAADYPYGSCGHGVRLVAGTPSPGPPVWHGRYRG